MPSRDSLFLYLLCFIVFSFLYCMLSAFTKLTAWLRSPGTRSAARQHWTPNSPPTHPPLLTRRHSTTTMFKQAVAAHKPSQPPRKITKIDKHFSSSPPTIQNAMSPPQYIPRNGTRPLHTSTGNITRPSQAPDFGRNVAPTIGSKRNSSGLAKALIAQDNDFENATLPPRNSYHNPTYIRESPTKKMGVEDLGFEFDEDDFDSEIDLEEENPATKATVTYPKLPTVPDPPKTNYASTTISAFQNSKALPAAAASHNRRTSQDSGYGTQMLGRMPGAFHNPLPKDPVTKPAPQRLPVTELPTIPSSPPQVPDSSLPLPWSSSPAEHFKTPPKVAQIRKFGYIEPGRIPAQPVVKEEEKPRTKRRTLPWLAEDKQQAEQADVEAKAALAAKPGRGRPRKEEQNFGEFTPLPKDEAKSYPWNTTASAVKEQQKQMREVNKKKTKTMEASQSQQEENKKRRTRISKIFLSEEQQHVMSLVIDHKKSVFFTGSAGKCLRTFNLNSTYMN
ncbi:hypothetical protein BU16DRAFT_2665 [Lophium mytilinum]|uniref:Uncharacterized protein n=1 Tax=Lophium mytilinum TaxID=390894 RepID=A0A6A6RFJ8_9PEZI|nr:hypothetical protein BU16DRAFT_2665 [Lophium mytilinum]